MQPKPGSPPLPNPLRHLHDRLERNTMAVLAGQTRERAANIAQTPAPLARELDAWMLRAVSRNPLLVARLLRRTVDDDTRIAGSGSTHTVVNRGDHVAKIHRPSTFMTYPQQEALAAEFSRLHTIQRAFLTDLVLPQTTHVAPHPLAPHRTAVVSEQLLTTFHRIDIFRAHEPTIDNTALDATLKRYPSVRSELDTMISAALRMHAETGLLLDCSGMDNIVITPHPTPRLTCLDGLPIATGSRNDTNRILGQLNALDAALSTRGS